MEKLIILVVFGIVSSIAQYYQKKQKAEAEAKNQGTPAAGPKPEPPPKKITWQEELRRVLAQEEDPTPVAPVPRALPPTPAAAPQPPPTPIIQYSRPAQPVRRPTPPAPVPSEVELGARQLAPLKESTQAYERASRLTQAVAAHMHMVPTQRVGSTSVVRKSASPDAVNALALFHSRQGARQAMIASVIIGPPRAFEDGFAR